MTSSIPTTSGQCPMHTGHAGHVPVRVLAAAELLTGQSRGAAHLSGASCPVTRFSTPQRRQLAVLEHGRWKAAGLPAPP